MMERSQFEQTVLTAVQDVIGAALPSLAERGVSTGGLEIVRSGTGDDYESELRIWAFRDGQLCDALEVHVWRGARPVATIEELREWFQAQLSDFG